MSNKRKIEDTLEEETDSDRETQLPSVCDKSEKRKAEEVSDDDKERLELRQLETKYQNRYTMDDKEYKEWIERPTSGPPIITNYWGKRNNHFRDRGHHRFNRGRGQRSDQRSDHNWRNRSFHNYNN